MKMDGQIRVRTDQRYRALYNDLKGFAIGDFHELFFICVCLANQSKARKPLERSGEDRFWSSTIAPSEWACYYAMLLEECDMDFSRIQDDADVMHWAEERANAGMEILLAEFLGDYLAGTTAEPRLDKGCSRELPKELLHHIFNSASPDIGAGQA
jgi:hypothetical protein